MILDGRGRLYTKRRLSGARQARHLRAWKLGQTSGAGDGCSAPHGTPALPALPLSWILFMLALKNQARPTNGVNRPRSADCAPH